jgi:hypothetical protein
MGDEGFSCSLKDMVKTWIDLFQKKLLKTY